MGESGFVICTGFELEVQDRQTNGFVHLDLLMYSPACRPFTHKPVPEAFAPFSLNSSFERSHGFPSLQNPSMRGFLPGLPFRGNSFSQSQRDLSFQPRSRQSFRLDFTS